MKKLMIALVAAAMAVGVQAASVSWNVMVDSSYKNWDAYLFKSDGSSIASLLETIADYDASGKSDMWKTGLGSSLDQNSVGRKGTTDGAVTGVEVDDVWTIVLFDTDIDVGANYAILDTITITADMQYEGAATPKDYADFENIVSEGTLKMADAPVPPPPPPVPEPTTYALIGVAAAALALRKRFMKK